MSVASNNRAHRSGGPSSDAYEAGWKDRLAARAVTQAEEGRISDALIRRGIDALIASRLRKERKRGPEWQENLRGDLWSGPIAVNAATANEQHYEIPGQFFDIVLGSRRKYSSGYWPSPVADLDAAEEAMLSLSAERAHISDGQQVLDLGSGWGSFTLWAAERYPNSYFVGVSNSVGQKRHIERIAEEAGLGNIKIVTADVNDYEPDRSFDRIVSIEMLEHVRNHRELFRRARLWLEDDGEVFVHVFAHRKHEYPYELTGPGSWMAHTFFTGGLMPSISLIPDAADPHFSTKESWWISGDHYSRTLEAWLDRMDNSTNEVSDVFESVYEDDLELWVQRWRMFFMACSQMFKYRHGSEWGISHHLLEPK